MKKVFAVLLALVMVLGTVGVSVSAADETIVYVTIADENGELALVFNPVEIEDFDEDGALTINDALIAAHDEFFDGGADEGYGYFTGDYGLSMSKLWGYDNGTGYGYYVNNASAWSLADPVQTGDHVYAFIYTDTAYWSDTYSWFDTEIASATEDEDITLTLSAAGYDASWNPVVVPVEGAVITVEGEATEYVTDAEGKVTLSLEEGSYLISATSDSMTLVPPVCIATVAASDDAGVADVPTLIAELPQTGVVSSGVLFAIGLAVIAVGGAFVIISNKKEYEK